MSQSLNRGIQSVNHLNIRVKSQTISDNYYIDEIFPLIEKVGVDCAIGFHSHADLRQKGEPRLKILSRLIVCKLFIDCQMLMSGFPPDDGNTNLQNTDMGAGLPWVNLTDQLLRVDRIDFNPSFFAPP